MRAPGYKSENQKYKSLLVMQYILKNADDEHAVTIGQIEDDLAKYGIGAERRSGKFYVVTPYNMLIDNGFFYLLTYNGTKTIVYHIDRMKDVKELLIVELSHGLLVYGGNGRIGRDSLVDLLD